MTRVSRKVHDKRLLVLIERYLRAGVMVDTELQPSIEGTPGRTRLAQSVSNLDEAYCEQSNRLVRTRLLGGVGGVPEQSGPLSRSLFCLSDVAA